MHLIFCPSIISIVAIYNAKYLSISLNEFYSLQISFFFFTQKNQISKTFLSLNKYYIPYYLYNN